VTDPMVKYNLVLSRQFHNERNAVSYITVADEKKQMA
jgi:hypothetical protein